MERAECTVRGALALALHVSRALGVAPLRIKRAHIGWGISCSKPFAIYSYVLISFLHVGMLYGLYFELSEPKEDSMLKQSAFSLVGWCTIFVIIGIIATTGVINGPKRMRLMIDYVYKIDNIQKKFKKTKTLSRNENKRTVVTGIIIFGVIFIYGITLSGDVIDDVGTEWRVLIASGCFFLECLMTLLLTTQFVLVGYMIDSSMKSINRSFETLISIDDLQIKPRPYSLIEGVLGIKMPLPKLYTFSTVAERRTQTESYNAIIADNEDPPRISSYGSAYAVVCSVLLQVNESFETMLILLISSTFTQLMVYLYSFVFSSNTSTTHYLVGVIRCFLQITILLSATEPVQCIKFQIQRLRFLLSHIYRRVDPSDPRCPELHFLYEQLTIDNPVFVVSGMCKLRRSIFFLMIGGIFTYITFLSQFQLSE